MPPQEVPPMSATATTPTSSATAALSAYNAAYASSYAQRYAQLGKSTLDRDRNHFSSGIKTSKKSCLGPHRRRFFLRSLRDALDQTLHLKRGKKEIELAKRNIFEANSCLARNWVSQLSFSHCFFKLGQTGTYSQNSIR